MKKTVVETDDTRVTTEYFLKNKRGEYNWLFNWTGGGFNDVWAKTKKEAEIAANKLGGTTLKPNLQTLRKATEETSRAQDREGYLMTC